MINKEELDEYELEIFIEKINDIIEQAIIHGGDTGGAYCSNEEKLLHSINMFLKWTGLDNYLTIYKDDIPKLLMKMKIQE